MGDSKALPGFGQVDLDIEEDAGAHADETVPPESSFGRVELELGEPDDPAPPSTSRVFNAQRAQGTQGPLARGVRGRGASVYDQSTRIVVGDALSEMTRPSARPEPQDDGSTRAWADIDSALADDDSHSSSGKHAAPSASGVASRDDRVSAMRELYARGDAAGALALASTLVHTVAVPTSRGSADSPDASIVVEFHEESCEADPFGGLTPVDDEEPPRVEDSSTGADRAPTAPPPAAGLTLTQRQSVPRRLIAMNDISKLDLDNRAGFLLTHVDGMQTLEEILDVCAMPASEALALLTKLEAMNAICFD